MSSYPNQNFSSIDQVVLTNIFHTYEDTCILTRNTYYPTYPAMAHTSAHTVFNEMSCMVKTCVNYFSRIPQFHNLIISDKMRLIKNNFVYMSTINMRMLYPITSSNLVKTWANLFPIEITQRIIKRNQIIDQFLFDPMILRIFLLIIILSSGNSRNIEYVDLDLICDDSLSIFAAQNFYVELLWKYILYRSFDGKTPVQLFNRLVILVLHVQSLGINVDHYLGNLRHEIRQMEPMLQSVWADKNTMQHN